MKAISERLRKILPGLRGYGETQLRDMRLFYKDWSFLDSNSSVTTDELDGENSSVTTDVIMIFLLFIAKIRLFCVSQTLLISNKKKVNDLTESAHP